MPCTSDFSTPRAATGLLVAFASALLLGTLAADVPAKSAGDDETGDNEGNNESGDDDQTVIQFLASTGVDGNGTARARWRDKGDGELDFNVELEELDAGRYDLYVTDLVTPRGSITVDGTGEGEIEFKTPLDGSKPLFDFTVFEQTVEVRQGATAYFTDTFSATGGGGGGSSSGDDSKTKTEVSMVNINAAVDFDAQGTLKYELKGSKTKFSIEVEKLDAGTYTLLVGGTPVGELTTTSSASVELEFQDPIEPGKTLLNFDPLGQQIDVALGGTVYLTGVLPGANGDTGTKPPGNAGKASKDLGKTKGDKLLVFLLNSGVLSGAQGNATLSQSGETELQVEIEDVPAGDYPLCVNGVQVGTLSADSAGNAQLDFSTSPGAGELLLDFEVKGQLVAVKSGADTILSVVFPTSVQAALGKYKKELFKSNKVKVNLINAGVDLDATGTVSWKLKGNGDQEVRIDVKDLPAGTYTIVVSGTPSASALTVGEKPASGKGKLVFATVAKGSKVVLDFDPVNATVQITDSNDVLLLQAVIDVP